MPSELRHILFRSAEVVQAVREYQARIQQPLPAGTVVECGPDTEGPGGAVRFRMSIAFQQGRSADLKTVRQDMVIEATTLAAALILYCRDRKIPLPASADKSLQRFGEQVGLVATYNPRQTAIPTSDQIQI